MPKHASNDIDYVPIEPDPKRPKTTRLPVLEPLPILPFIPMIIIYLRLSGQARIPSNINLQLPL